MGLKKIKKRIKKDGIYIIRLSNLFDKLNKNVNTYDEPIKKCTQQIAHKYDTNGVLHLFINQPSTYIRNDSMNNHVKQHAVIIQDKKSFIVSPSRRTMESRFRQYSFAKIARKYTRMNLLLL